MKQSILFFQRISLLLSAVLLLAGCSGSDSEEQEKGGGSQPEIRFNADVWQVMERTRATTFDAGAVNGSFQVYAYNYDQVSTYITGEIVNYSGGASSWVHPQFWPDGNGALDFFAFMPTDLTGTCCSYDYTAYNESTNPDGYSAGTPRIACTNLPVSITAGNDATQELVYAYTRNQTKASNGAGVVLTFKRPFARVYLKKADGLTGVTINSVTIADIKNNGLCTFNGTTTSWTPSGDDTNLVVTGSPATGDTPYLVLPQNLGSKTISVNASWSSWSSVPAVVSTTLNLGSWEAGYSYTYTFTLKDEALIVNVEKFTEQW